jgi:N-dimethylarginine dimethylaminohydrolase
MTASPPFGVRSMVAPLRRVLVVRPTSQGDFAAAGWREPEVTRLVAEHEQFCALVAGLGVEVVLAQAPDGLVDACFAYDSVFVVGSGAIVLRMVKPARQGEPDFLAAEVERAGVPLVGRLAGPATADGGDMCWLDESTLAVGRSYRTNAAAHDQLRELLSAEGVTVARADLPHHLGAAHVMHLMSVVSPVAEDLAVVFEPLAPVPLLELLAERGYRTVACDPDEFDSQGCNVLAVRPGVVVMTADNPATRRALEKVGVEVHTYEATEINKGDGGPTCLTRPLLRESSPAGTR